MSRPLQEKTSLLNPNRNNLPKRNRFFTGTKDILLQLNKLFSVSKGVATVQILSGLSGIGKTNIALEFCHLCINDYQTILWVNAENEITINNSYFDIVRLLGLVATGNLSSFNLQQNILLVNHWLSSHSNWLLVWDNLQEGALLTQLLPSKHKGHILVTTCQPNCQSLLGYPYIIDLPKMSIDTGELFLLKKAGLLSLYEKDLELISRQDRSIAQQIVKEVDGIPLALSLVGAYLEQTKYSLDDYLNRYKNIRYSNSKANIDNQDFDINSCFTTIYTLSIDKIAQQNLIATQLIQVCSLLSSSSIAEEIFTKSNNLLGGELATLSSDISYYNEIVQLLSSYSFIEKNNINQSISIHSLIQEIVIDSLDDNIKLGLVEGLTKALSYLTANDPKDSQSWSLYQRLLPSALALSEVINVINFKSLETGALFYQLGVYCQHQSQFNQALDCYFVALTSYRSLFDENHASIAITLNNIGEVYRSQEMYYLALNCYLESLECYKELFQDSHPSVGMTLANLGILCAETARENEAIDYYKQALQVFEESLPANHPWVIKILRLYSRLLVQLNRNDEAQLLLKRIEL